MAWTQTDLDAIKAAYARGVKSVTLPSGLRTDYASMTEMRDAIREIQAELRSSSTTRLKPRYQQARFDD